MDLWAGESWISHGMVFNPYRHGLKTCTTKYMAELTDSCSAAVAEEFDVQARAIAIAGCFADFGDPWATGGEGCGIDAFGHRRTSWASKPLS